MPRGTLETEFVHKPFAELRRLGLTRESEARVRAAYPNQTGMLVVEQVIPESPASSKLQAGDILIEIDGKLIAEFVPLDAQLDAAVGKQVHVVIERGGKRIESTLPVGDLHDITPAEYIEYGDGVFHKLSYQQARHLYRPVKGVYVANPGYVFGKAAIPRGSIVTGMGSEKIDDLDDLQRALESAARCSPGRRALRELRRATERAAEDHHERPELVPGVALPPRRHARRMAVQAARGERAA